MNKFYKFLRALVCTVLFVPHLQSQTIYYVNASTGNDVTGDGSSGTPYKTITKAMTVSSISGDQINVAAGTYNTALGEVFPITVKSGRILTGTAGALTTTINATGANQCVLLCNANVNTTVVQGFTITGGNNVGDVNTNFTARGGGIISTTGDQTIIRQNIITGNTAIGYNGLDPAGSGFRSGGNSSGGGIYVSSASPMIVNNVISNNTAQGGIGWSFNGGTSTQAYDGGSATGGGIDASFANTMTIINNTFYGNAANGGNGGATNSSAFPTPSGGSGSAGALSAGSNVTVKNNIFSNNSSLGGNPGSGSGGGSVGTASDGALSCSTAGNLSYNLYFNNTATTNADGGTLGSTGNVFADPQFLSATNYHFPTSSPAWHVGTSTGAPATDLDGTARGGTPSIGAYEGPDPLPVELVSFVARAIHQNVELHWSTATEVNNYGFEVERLSMNTEQSTMNNAWWQKSGFVEGAGSSNSPREYSFVDENLRGGTYSYRLKQIDRDGKVEYSNSVEVELAIPKWLSLSQNYPNPFNPSTTIEFTLPEDGRVTLKVYDVLGKEVAALVNGELEAGVVHRATFDASQISNGIYFFRLEHFGKGGPASGGNGKQLMRKLLLVK